jgi:conjugal transfer pilus assembly protein TrbC
LAVNVYAEGLTTDIERLLNDNNAYRRIAEEVFKEMQKLKNSEMADEGKALGREMLKDKDRYIDGAIAILERDDLRDMRESAKMSESCVDSEQLGNPTIYIFVSSSMPEQTLKNYADTVAKLAGDGIMVLNGTIGDPQNLKPTLNFITKLNCGKTLDELQKNYEQCNVSQVDINPLLFRIFNVREVPAIVWSNISYAELLGMANMGESLNSNQYGLIYGDMSVEHALERFSRSTLKIDTKPYMQKLKPGYFGGKR